MATWKGIVGKGFRSDGFAAYVSTLTFSEWRPQFVVVHNTSLPRLSQWHSTPGEQRMRNLEHFYRDQQKWSAGPHVFIADDLIWVFTPLTVSGVHSPSWNGVSWGVEMVGEYEDEPFGPAVRENTVDALAVLHACRGLNPDTIRFHKEDPLTTHKTCPGKNVNKADLISRVHDRMNGGDRGEHVPPPATAITASSPAAATDSAMLDTFARTIWGEARGEGKIGMEAVACVIRNRVRNPRWWGKDYSSVCLHPFQFSCWNANDPNLPKLRSVTDADPQFRTALEVASDAGSGNLADPTGNADSYFAVGTPEPSWARTAAYTRTIGHHAFYRVSLPPGDAFLDAPTGAHTQG
jgi:hypothetical protein